MSLQLKAFSAASELMLASVSGIIIAAVSALGELPPSVTIWDKSQLRMYCIIGALGGAILAVAIFPPVDPTKGSDTRRLAAKFIASGVAGIIFTPILIRWQGWTADVDIVLGVSGAVALLAVSVINMMVPYILKRLGKRLDEDDK